MGFPQTIKGDRGQLVVTDCRYGDPSASAADWWDFGVDPKLHVSDITQYIIDHGRAEYDMQVEAGCRLWVLKVMADIVSKDWCSKHSKSSKLPTGVGKEVKEIIGYKYSLYVGPIPNGVVEGTFL